MVFKLVPLVFKLVLLVFKLVLLAFTIDVKWKTWFRFIPYKTFTELISWNQKKTFHLNLLLSEKINFQWKRWNETDGTSVLHTEEYFYNSN